MNRPQSPLNVFQKTHPGRIINQYDVARLLSPAFLKSAVAINKVHGFERPGIWPVNKYAFGDEDYEPAAVVAGTSNMNIRTEGTNSLERIDIPGSSLIQEFVSPNALDPLAEIIPSPSRATIHNPSELRAFVAPIVVSQDSLNTPEKIRSDVGCTPKPEPGCSQVSSAFEPDNYLSYKCSEK